MAQMEISKKIALFPDKETTEQFFRFAGTARWGCLSWLSVLMNIPMKS